MDAAEGGGKTQMLNKVITTYLRRPLPRRQSLLLGPTMEGLAKFAHLIDHGLFDLLLKAIRDALDSPATTLAATLHGIVTQQQQDASASAGIAVDISSLPLHRVLPAAMDCSSHHDERSKVDEEEVDAADGGASAAADAATVHYGPRVTMFAGRGAAAPRNTLRERTERAALALRACDLLLLRGGSITALRDAEEAAKEQIKRAKDRKKEIQQRAKAPPTPLRGPRKRSHPCPSAPRQGWECRAALPAEAERDEIRKYNDEQDAWLAGKKESLRRGARGRGKDWECLAESERGAGAESDVAKAQREHIERVQAALPGCVLTVRIPQGAGQERAGYEQLFDGRRMMA
eukprot:gene24632-5592_t